MSHFNFENCISELTKLDAPITRGPMMRWQRKAIESGVRHLSVPNTGTLSGLSPRKPKSAGSGTPCTPFADLMQGTPSKDQIDKIGRKSTKTPKKTPSTPLNKQSDRFIPNRSSTNIDTGYHAMMNTENENPDEHSKADFMKNMSTALSEQQVVQPVSKILSFNQKAPACNEGHNSNLKVLYSSSSARPGPKPGSSRYIPTEPERTMDAPHLNNDFYLNLMDWSANNNLGIALGNEIYNWNAHTMEVTLLAEFDAEYVGSVSWIKEGSIMAVGLSGGSIQKFNNVQCVSGSRSGAIHHHDVRVPDHHVGSLLAHSQEVCGLKWSPNCRYLASGGNDNLVHIWSEVALSHDVAPLHVFSEHQAAVKALAWCPWQPNILATGGGTLDRSIRFWNVNSGECLHNVLTNSQVCALQWSKTYKEIVSAHGFSQNELIIWKYPAMTKISVLKGHTARILCMASSPDGSIVASAAGDESIRLWSCFLVDKPKKGATKSVSEMRKSSSVLSQGIR